MLKIINISRSFDDFSIKNISFEIKTGDYYIILGGSGVGKSLLLEIIAGLINPDSGKISINNRDITHEKIQKRKIGLVFQDYAVFPHMTVYDNIAYPLRRKYKKNQISDNVAKID